MVEPHPLVTVTDINPEDIPDVPVNKFLMRGGENKKDGDKRNDRKGSVKAFFCRLQYFMCLFFRFRARF